MNNNRKALLLVLCAVLLVAASVLGTVAYLTDTAAARNTFTVGKVDITLDEAKVDEYGTAVNPAERVTENTYKLIPGHSYTKDPTVTVLTGSAEAYIRMIVTVDNKAALDAIGVNIVEVFQGYDSTKWTLAGQTIVDDTRVYEFRYYTTVSTADAEDKALEPLFKTMAIPGTVTNAQLNTLQDLTITIEAHAIQAEGFADADAAWAAFPNK